jgi:hypothetical protein
MNVPAKDLIPPEQAIYNVLYVYCSGTLEASLFDGSTGPNPAPLNCLQIYSDDVLYAELNHDNKVPIKEIDGTWGFITAQGLLDAAALQLQKIA